jgi:DNA replication protein DnaC
MTSKNNTIINSKADMMNPIGDALTHNYIAKNFNHSFQTIASVEKFYLFLENCKKDFVVSEFEITSNSKTYYIKDDADSPTFLYLANVSLSKTVTLECFAESVELSAELYLKFKEYEYNDDDVYIGFYKMSLGEKGIESVPSNKLLKDFKNDSADFYPYIDVELMFKQFVASKEKILILVGDPGLGKTKMANLYMKFMLENPAYIIEHNNNDAEKFEYEGAIEMSVAYIKNQDLLATDQLWSAISQNPYPLVFIDDIGPFLARTSSVESSEDKNRNSFMSNFLSFTDGVESNHTKFIITTNEDLEDLDNALMRDGRMFDVLCLRELKYEEAKKIWLNRELNLTDFEKLFEKDKDVSPSALGSNIDKYKNTDVSITTVSYLKEDDISIVKTLGKKVIGF